MRSTLALWAFRTESSQVVWAQASPYVLLGAYRPQWTKSHVIVRTRRQSRHGIDVKIQALLAIGAVAVAHEEIALRHLTEVIFVQKLTWHALLA